MHLSQCNLAVCLVEHPFIVWQIHRRHATLTKAALQWHCILGRHGGVLGGIVLEPWPCGDTILCRQMDYSPSVMLHIPPKCYGQAIPIHFHGAIFAANLISCLPLHLAACNCMSLDGMALAGMAIDTRLPPMVRNWGPQCYATHLIGRHWNTWV